MNTVLFFEKENTMYIFILLIFMQHYERYENGGL